MLYVCATPIGNLGDVTLRVLDALRAVELIAAEDTRHTRKLLARYDIHTPLTSLFEHNEARKTAYVLGLLRDGKDVALVTDAGTPGVSDPGSRLVAAALREGLPLTVLPGPSAVAAAVAASGLATDDGFRFVGYLPRRAAELRAAAGSWAAARRPRGGLRDAAASGAQLGRARGGRPRRGGGGVPRAHEAARRGRARHARGARRRFAAGTRGEITLVLDFGPVRAGRGVRVRLESRRRRAPWPRRFSPRAFRGATRPRRSPSVSGSRATRPTVWSRSRRGRDERARPSRSRQPTRAARCDAARCG